MNSSSLITTSENELSNFYSFIQRLEHHMGSCETLKNLIGEETNKIKEVEEYVIKLEKVSDLFKLIAEQSQNQISKIERLCTEALKEILGDSHISLKIVLNKKKAGTETVFYINDSLIGDVDLLHGEAGGTKNIIAVGLRLIFSELYYPKVSGPIIMDEPGVNISEGHQVSFGKFLKKFSNLTGRQLILVTHWEPVIQESDHKITVRKKGNLSTVY